MQLTEAPTALPLLAAALDASLSPLERLSFAVDALAEVLPSRTHGSEDARGFDVRRCRENGIVVELIGRDFWPVNGWTLTTEQACAVAWEIYSSSVVDRMTALDAGEAGTLAAVTLEEVDAELVAIAHEAGERCAADVCCDCDERESFARSARRELYLDGAADYAMDAAKDRRLGVA